MFDGVSLSQLLSMIKCSLGISSLRIYKHASSTKKLPPLCGFGKWGVARPLTKWTDTPVSKASSVAHGREGLLVVCAIIIPFVDFG